MPLIAEYQAAMRQLGEKDFSYGSLEGYINAKVLVEALKRAGGDPTPASVKTALETLKSHDLGGIFVKFSPAIAERDAMLKKHFVLSEQIIRGSGLSESEVNEGLAGLNSSKGTVQKNYADLTTAQLASVKATENILDFAQRGLGRITVQNGQPMFQTQSELEEYQRLVQVLTDAAATETILAQKVQAQAQKSKQTLVDQLK